MYECRVKKLCLVWYKNTVAVEEKNQYVIQIGMQKLSTKCAVCIRKNGLKKRNKMN